MKNVVSDYEDNMNGNGFSHEVYPIFLLAFWKYTYMISSNGGGSNNSMRGEFSRLTPMLL